MSQDKRSAAPGVKARFRNVDVTELHAILERSKVTPLASDDYTTLKSAVDTLTFLMGELQLKGASLERLRRLIFGPSTEKTRAVLKGEPTSKPAEKTAAQGAGKEEPGKKKAKQKGHGRNGSQAYPGADKVAVPHPSLHAGNPCPGCGSGKVYACQQPAQLLRVVGMAPLSATVFECERVRCNACGEVFTAPAPDGVGEEKYDASAAAMVAMLRYGVGLPFHRLERLQRGMGIPLPASTQWDLVESRAEALEPVFDALVTAAAQGEVLHNDDTPMTVLELSGGLREPALAGSALDDEHERSGVRTSGIVARVADKSVALFFTGRKHAGENLADVLQERKARLPPPIQMCDALSHNTAGDFDAILAHCLVHARRHFVDIVAHFPDECAVVLETLREVYRHDAHARQEKLSAEQRLVHHQAHSAAPMAALHTYMQAQLDEHKVEPNSALGEALRYMLKHWRALTLFLCVAGAPLDNNLCERALKKAILHRKNSLFYKTLRGARVGDMYMSLIHTAELNHVDVFAYLCAVMRHPDAAAQTPKAWMPWNYPEAQKPPGASAAAAAAVVT